MKRLIKGLQVRKAFIIGRGPVSRHYFVGNVIATQVFALHCQQAEIVECIQLS